MQQGFPITIKFDSQISLDRKATVAASKVEMWVNFSALKSGWYADESCVLEVEFILLEQNRLNEMITKHGNEQWQIEDNQQFAIIHDKAKTHVDAYVAIETEQHEHFEVKLKASIATIANIIAKDYLFTEI